jgi:hypothetical protein
LKTGSPGIAFGFVGPPALEQLVFTLPLGDLTYLLGPAATAEDSRSLNLEEVKATVDALMASIGRGLPPSTAIKPVPADKLAFNKLPAHWVGLIEMGSKNAPHVLEYFERHPVAETGSTVARHFADRYTELKQQGLDAGAIMDSLYERLAGIGTVTPARQVATHALLAYLFDACDIFEDHPSKVLA